MILTTTAAAKALGLTPGRVRQMIRAGQLPAVKAGRDWLIEKTNLKLVETRRRRGRPRKGANMNEYVIIDEGGQYVGMWTCATAAKAAGGTAAMPDAQGCVNRATLAKG